jgi:glucosylceramidase
MPALVGFTVAQVNTVDTSSGSAVMTLSSVPVGSQALDPTLPQIRMDPSKRYQTIDGFGGALTQSCVTNLMKLPKDERRALLSQMFSPLQGGLSYLRVPVGATDFSTNNYTYADDPKKGLAGFSMSRDQNTLDILNEIVAINPRTQIMLSVWSPPKWMKDSNSYDAGHLKAEDYDLYAQYFIKTLQAYEALGLHVRSMTVANEPHFTSSYSKWNSMQMTPQNESDFVLNDLAPDLKAAGLSPQVYLNDHNYEYVPQYAKVLENSRLRRSIKGLAFHCYGGSLDQAAQLQEKYPEIATMNTECTGTLGSNVEGDFSWWIEHQGISAQNEGFSGDIGWNLCLDQAGRPINKDQSLIPFFGLNIDMICKNCRGMVTIDQNTSPRKFIFNPEYMALSLMARVEDPGSQRIGLEISGPSSGVNATAVQNPDGSYGVVVENQSSLSQTIQVQSGLCQTIQVRVPAHGASSFRW